MSCKGKIVKNIINDCQSFVAGGIEQDFVYLINRSDMTVTMNSDNDVIIDDITIAEDASVYKLKGAGQNIVVGADRVVGTDIPDLYTHYISFKGFEWDSASIANLDNMSDLVAIVKRKGTNVVDGKLEVYGLQGGLYVSSDTFRSNTDNMTRAIEMTSLEGAQEVHSVYTYMQASTKTSPSTTISTDAEKIAEGIEYLDSLLAE